MKYWLFNRDSISWDIKKTYNKGEFFTPKTHLNNQLLYTYKTTYYIGSNL